MPDRFPGAFTGSAGSPGGRGFLGDFQDYYHDLRIKEAVVKWNML